MTSFPMMSNTAHSRHHRAIITSTQPRKRSFIGHIFGLSNDFNSTTTTPIGILNDNISPSATQQTSTQFNTRPSSTPPPSSPPNSRKHSSPAILRSISEWSTPQWKFADNTNTNNNKTPKKHHSSSLTTIMNPPKGFDHHLANTLERLPQTPNFQPTRNLLQDSSSGMLKVMQTLFNQNIGNVS